MSRPKKDSKVLNVKLATPVHDKLDQFCDETCMNKTVAVERILDQFFVTYFEKPETERMIFNRTGAGASASSAKYLERMRYLQSVSEVPLAP